MRSLSFLLITAVVAFAPQLAAQPTPEPMTLKQIMADPDWLGTPPRDAYWAEDGNAVYFTKKRIGERVDDLWMQPLDGSEARVVPLDELPAHGVAGGDRNADRTLKAFVRHGDLYVQDLRTGAVRQLTRAAVGYSQPRFLNDGRIAVRMGDSFFAYDLDAGRIERLAEIRFEQDPHEKRPGDDYLSAQQRRLIQVIRERQQRVEDERAHERRSIATDPGRPARAWYLGERRRLVAAELSPNGRWLLVATAARENDNGPRRDTVPFFVTDDGYVENRPVRSKVGVGEPGPHAYALLDLHEGTKRDLDLATLPGIDRDPLRRMRQQRGLPALEGQRATAWMDAAWTREGDRVALMLRSVDNKDRWLAVVNPADGRVVPRHRLTDEAWINWYTSRDLYWFNDFGWMRDGQTLWWLSEESGYSHLYVQGPRDRRARALTSGRFEVSNPVLTRDERHFYYVANAEHPGIHEVYRVPVAGGQPERLTHLNARTTFVLSPDERQLLLTSSSVLRHDELFVQPAQPSPRATQLTDTMSERFKSYPWAMPQTVAIPSTHVRGRSVYSRVYVPADFDPERAERYPVAMFAHGAGYLQNVHYGWSSYFREFMFHTYLVERGYIVIDMDFRASAGYGRDWRTAIYRDMGRPELQDFKDGIDWLVRNRNADRSRVGIYGGSYGGFLAFMGLFLEPDMFQSGAALRPVSDWAHYHHPYTANILNTPDLDPEAFERSSPIEYAEGLNKPLLILAPMVDTNVLFKDVVRLVQRLIELEKTEYFETAIYPVEDHAFIEPSSWLDEYRRIFMLFERTLK